MFSTISSFVLIQHEHLLSLSGITLFIARSLTLLLHLAIGDLSTTPAFIFSFIGIFWLSTAIPWYRLFSGFRL
jgi:hypothetical protein